MRKAPCYLFFTQNYFLVILVAAPAWDQTLHFLFHLIFNHVTLFKYNRCFTCLFRMFARFILIVEINAHLRIAQRQGGEFRVTRH